MPAAARHCPTFALPERLAAKADPALIAEDERHFRAIQQSLRTAIEQASEQLESWRQAEAGSGQRALDRDLEVHRLSGRIATLQRFGLDLCLGRIVPADGSETVYIGRLGLTDSDGDRLLVDWRSAAAQPYFGATLAQPQGLISRRRYRWANGRVSDYWDEVFDPDRLSDEAAEQAALDQESAFILSLGRARSGRMQDVLGTIQADQDAIIRGSSRGALVVDGGPGTGKTVVALHRAAYLLYADPRLGRRRGGVLFVGPHQPYLRYVADVLPSLGEQGVRTCTLAELVPEGATAAPEADEQVVRLKSSGRLVDAIEPAVALYEKPPAAATTVETEHRDLQLAAADWARAFEVVEPGTPHNDAQQIVWEELLSILVENTDGEVPEPALRRALRGNRELRVAFTRAWPLLRPGDVVGDLFTVPAYLRMCAPWLEPEEVAALQRADPGGWTVSDLPLLDAARQRLGDPDASRRNRRREAVVASEVEQRARVVDDLIATDDSEMHVMSMLKGDDLRQLWVDQDTLPGEEVDDLAGPFAHVVVDEAQELTDAQWQMLRSRCPSGSFTVVGDRTQSRRGFTETWTERLQRVGLSDITLAGLSINYRTPSEVMAEAEPVIRAVLPDANVPTSVRRSGVAVTYGAVADLAQTLSDWLAATAEGTACVIGETDMTMPPRVAALRPELVKGLEFDLVVLLDPGSWAATVRAARSGTPSGSEGGVTAAPSGSAITAAVDRYVAMTRATQQLVILGEI